MFNKVFRSAIGAGMVLGFTALTGCGAASSSDATDLAKKKVAVTGNGIGNASGSTSTTTTTTATTATTTTATTVAGPVASPSLDGLAPIADNFNTSTGMVPLNVAIPPLDAGGAFRISCIAGQLLRDDPIFLPGQPGASHLHQFWGNTGANANSTYQSLRTSGQSTCTNPSAGPVNRAAYWMPAMLDGAGNVVKPDTLETYYKQFARTDPECTVLATACLPLPNGIRYTFGYNMTTMSGGITDPNAMEYWVTSFTCVQPDEGTPVVNGGFHTIDAIVAAGCPAGVHLHINFIAPDCWDGKNVDVADHRSHMAYPTRSIAGQTNPGCPLDHPYMLPNWSGWISYTTDANFVAGKWHFSSDDMLSQMTGQKVAAGTTLHFDYFEGWSPTVKATWQKYCIDGHLSCSAGELGDGTEIDPGNPATRPVHQLVSLSTIP